MKVLHIITTLSSGGAERMLSKICNNDYENEHIIITILDSKQHYEINKNVKIISLKRTNNIITKLSLVIILQKLVKKINPDIINLWMNLCIYAPVLKSNNIKIIANYRNSFYAENKLNKYLTLYASRFCDGNIFVSKKGLFERESAGFKLRNPIVIGNGFESQKYEYNLSDNLTFGYLGRFHKVKNQKLLLKSIQAFKNVNDIQFLLAGKNLKPHNFPEFNLNQPNLTWLGELESDKISEFYKSIDCLILTSNYEGFPNVIGEAMSFGIPVISTDAGESFEIIGDTGFKISSDEQDLINVINSIRLNKTLLVEKSLKAHKRLAEKYSINSVINKYQTYYEYICKY